MMDMASQVSDKAPRHRNGKCAPIRRMAAQAVDPSRKAARCESELEVFQKALNEHAIVGITNARGIITNVNDKFCRITGYSREDLVGRDHRILNSGHHPRAFFQNMWKTISSGKVWRAEICNRAKNGETYWVDTTIAPRRDRNGRILGYVSVRFDITGRKRAEERLHAENRKREEAEGLLRDIVESLPNGIVAYDARGEVIFYNSTHKRFYNVAAPCIAIGTSIRDISSYAVAHGQFEAVQADPDASENWLVARLADHHGSDRTFIDQLSDGRWLQVQNRRSQSGNLVSVQTDITDLKEVERHIRDQSERDPLTGIANRRALLDRLSSLVDASASRRSGAAIFAIDLDDFKAINDRFGHDGGDQFLSQIAQQLLDSVRKTDLVARLGGDEFALIVYDIATEADVERVAQKLLQALCRPIRIGSREITPSGSIGVALFPRDGDTPQDLIKNADLALYEAKAGGRRTYALYNRKLRRDRRRRQALTERLRLALDRQEIEVALQPQVSLVTGRHSGFEALVRWRVGRHQVSAPEIVSIAHEAGLMVRLGDVVIGKALTILGNLKRRGFDPGVLAFNVAAEQLRDEFFARRLLKEAQIHGIPATDLEIEVTEDVILDRSAEMLVRTLRELHRNGIRISLDDFGTGYASLSHLKRFPIDRLKIDKSFVAAILAGEDDAIIVRTIISLAHSLGLEVVAEGVENVEQKRELSNYGCDFAQGFYFGYPMNCDAVAEYLHRVSETHPSLIYTNAQSL